MTPLWITLAVVGLASILIVALLATALQVATSHLEEQEHEPVPVPPHRPTWEAPVAKGIAGRRRA